jgi:hypothetical protein
MKLPLMSKRPRTGRAILRRSSFSVPLGEFRERRTTMFRGNLYGIILSLLTLAAAVGLTARQMEDKGLHFELTIEPFTRGGRSPLRKDDKGGFLNQNSEARAVTTSDTEL